MQIRIGQNDPNATGSGSRTLVIMRGHLFEPGYSQTAMRVMLMQKNGDNWDDSRKLSTESAAENSNVIDPDPRGLRDIQIIFGARKELKGNQD